MLGAEPTGGEPPFEEHRNQCCEKEAIKYAKQPMHDPLVRVHSTQRFAGGVLHNEVPHRQDDLKDQEKRQNPSPPSLPLEPGKGEKQDCIDLITR